jgi:hypothetical protein
MFPFKYNTSKRLKSIIGLSCLNQTFPQPPRADSKHTSKVSSPEISLARQNQLFDKQTHVEGTGGEAVGTGAEVGAGLAITAPLGGVWPEANWTVVVPAYTVLVECIVVVLVISSLDGLAEH